MRQKLLKIHESNFSGKQFCLLIDSFKLIEPNRSYSSFVLLIAQVFITTQQNIVKDCVSECFGTGFARQMRFH